MRSSIVGGKTAEPHSYPWMTYLLIGNSQCGGALINNNHIITAAHCFGRGKTDADLNQPSYLKSIYVTVGGHTISNPTRASEPTQKVCQASRVFLHPDYNKSPQSADAAVIKLDCNVEFTDAIRPLCMPTTSDNFQQNVEKVLIAGWGLTRENGQTSRDLLQAVVKTVPTSQCNQKYGIIDQTMMCAMDQGVDSCQGDSGGPLVVVKDGKYTIAGIVSFGSGCARPDVPGVYAHVPTPTIYNFLTKAINS